MTKKSVDINYISKDLFPRYYNRTMIDDDYIKCLEKENKRLNGAIQTYDILLKSNVEENKQLKDNWNNLKEKINEGIRVCENRNYDLVFDIKELPEEELNEIISYLAFKTMKDVIIYIEQGSDK